MFSVNVEVIETLSVLMRLWEDCSKTTTEIVFSTVNRLSTSLYPFRRSCTVHSDAFSRAYLLTLHCFVRGKYRRVVQPSWLRGRPKMMSTLGIRSPGSSPYLSATRPIWSRTLGSKPHPPILGHQLSPTPSLLPPSWRHCWMALKCFVKVFISKTPRINQSKCSMQ